MIWRYHDFIFAHICAFSGHSRPYFAIIDEAVGCWRCQEDWMRACSQDRIRGSYNTGEEITKPSSIIFSITTKKYLFQRNTEIILLIKIVKITSRWSVRKVGNLGALGAGFLKQKLPFEYDPGWQLLTFNF